MADMCNWPLGNGDVLSFEVYSKNNGWNDAPGLYIFAYQSTSAWHALYVGQTDSFLSRLPNHDKLNEAVRRGATHIHAKIVGQQHQRDTWEKMLIQHLQPPMNVQHRQPTTV